MTSVGPVASARFLIWGDKLIYLFFIIITKKTQIILVKIKGKIIIIIM